MSVYRYPNLSPDDKKAHNSAHHRIRRGYYREREKERSKVREWMRTHEVEVEEIKRRVGIKCLQTI